MYYPKDAETNETTDPGDEHHLVLDGTVSLDDADDDSVPRVRGLIELLSDYFRD